MSYIDIHPISLPMFDPLHFSKFVFKTHMDDFNGFRFI